MPVISVLSERCPSVEKVQNLYHYDVVGRYLCRILNIFATRESAMLNESTLSWIYSMMDKDLDLGLFSLRIGQVPNLYLYKKKNVKKSIKAYKHIRRVRKIFGRGR